MQRKTTVTAEEGRTALHAHLVERATVARERHPVLTDEAAVRRLLEDEEVVRFPTCLLFEDDGLQPGEFAWPRPRGGAPGDGFDLLVRSCFADKPGALAALVAYHVPSINYLDVASREEAELYGATLLDMEVDAYYALICELVDGMPAGVTPADPDAVALLDELEGLEPE
jgi:hypothetical protein